MYKMLSTLNEAVSERAQKAAMKEWRILSAEAELFVTIGKKMTARIKELEGILMPVVKEMTDQKGVIDNAILEYKMSSGKSSVSYSELYTRALEIATQDQKDVLETFKKSITKTGTGTESLKIVDPKLQKILNGVSDKLTVEELKMKLVQIAELPDNIHGEDTAVKEGFVIDTIKKALKFIKGCFKDVEEKQIIAGKSAKALLKAAKAISAA